MATTELHKALAETIRTLRTVRGLSQADLAARAHLSDVYVRQIELAERDISIVVLAKLAHGLGCTPRDLFPAEGESAVAPVVGAAYKGAPEAVQRAIVFLLREVDGSPLKEALLTLIATEREPPKPRRRRRPKRAAPALEPTPGTKKPRRTT